MTLKDQLDALLDATAFDSTGTKIGAVRQVYVDDASGKITFATVSTGIFSSDAIVPLHGARLLDDELHVDHTRTVIRDSPRPDHTEDALTPEQEVKLLEYYGIETPVRGRETAPTAPGTTPAATQRREAGAQDGATPATGTPEKKESGKKREQDAPKAGEKSPEDAPKAGEKSPEDAPKAGRTSPQEAPKAAKKPGKKSGEKPGPTTTRPPETAVGGGRGTATAGAPESAGGTPDSGSGTHDSPGREPRS